MPENSSRSEEMLSLLERHKIQVLVRPMLSGPVSAFAIVFVQTLAAGALLEGQEIVWYSLFV